MQSVVRFGRGASRNPRRAVDHMNEGAGDRVTAMPSKDTGDAVHGKRHRQAQTSGRVGGPAPRSTSRAPANRLEALNFPRLRPLADLRKDAPQALEGALPVLVPAKLPARSVRVSITLDERLLSRINAAARAAGEDRSAYLAEAAKERMAR